MVNSGKTSAAESAHLLGRMIAGLLVETGQAAIACRVSLFSIAQGIIGYVVTNALTSEIIHSFAAAMACFSGYRSRRTPWFTFD
jgi:uncharacterized membrane protein AbrB (regulator of aidB expression)